MLSKTLGELDTDSSLFLVRKFGAFLDFKLTTKTPSIIGKRVSNYQELAINILNENLMPSNLLSPQLKVLLIQKALDELYGRHDISYARLITKRFDDIRLKFSGNEFESRLKNVKDKKLRGKLEASLMVMKRYNEFKKLIKLHDLAGLLETATNYPLDNKNIVLFMPTIIYPLYKRFLRNKAKDVDVFLPELGNFFFDDLRKSNESIVPDFRIKTFKLNPIARSLDLKVDSIKSSTDVYVNSFDTPDEDIRFIATSIRALLDDGYMPHEIAVTGRSLDGKELLFYRIFSAMGIPVRLQTRGIPMTASPFVRNFLMLLLNSPSVLKGVEVDVPDYLRLSEWVAFALKVYEKSEFNEAEALNEFKAFYNELVAFERLFGDSKISSAEAYQTLSELLKDRYFRLDNSDSYGVHIGSPETVSSIFPKVLFVHDTTNFVYPRSFPFDPDFSYDERRSVNEAFSCSLIDQVLPERERLIKYEFLTFYNLISQPTEKLFLTYNRLKGKSIFVSRIEEVKTQKHFEESLFMPGSVSAYEVDRGLRKPNALFEKGIDACRRRLSGENDYNFIIDKEIPKRYIGDLSVTDIISYLTCPTNVLFSRILSYKEGPSLAAAEGQIYHKCIERFCRSPFNDDEFEMIVNGVSGSLKPDDRREILLLKGVIRENARNFINILKKSELVNGNFEVEKKLDIKLCGRKLSGRADWILKNDGGYKIVDFKRSSVKYKNGKSNYAPGNPKSIQVILYGLSLLNRDVLKAYKDGLYSKLAFSFVSVPKASAFNDNYTYSFHGDKNSIGRSLKLAMLALRAMENGVFTPYSIGFDGKDKIKLKDSGLCNFDAYIDDEKVKSILTKLLAV